MLSNFLWNIPILNNGVARAVVAWDRPYVFLSLSDLIYKKKRYSPQKKDTCVSRLKDENNVFHELDCSIHTSSLAISVASGYLRVEITK